MPDSQSNPDNKTIGYSTGQFSASGNQDPTTAGDLSGGDPGLRISERDLVHKASEIKNGPDREAFLARACGVDKLLRQRVQDLINNQEKTRILEAGETIEISKIEPKSKIRDESPTFDHYVVGPEIARGGMGSIRVAEDIKLKRSVAIKVIHRDTPSGLARFHFEAEVLAQLAHPNIVPIHDFVRENGKPLFYSMKLVKGRTLQAIINDLREEKRGASTEFTLDRLLLIFRKVCDAMAFAHSRGIIHRDLKPENIMVGEFGEVLVMDWGLAKKLGETPISEIDASIDPGTENFAETLQGDVMGTPQYMSPEQASGDIAQIDQRSDIFSLGGILYAILTLRPPIEGTTLQEVLDKVSRGEIVSPTTYGPASGSGRQKIAGGVLEAKKVTPLPHISGGKVPLALSAVVMNALQLEKVNRYPDVESLSADIEAYQGGFATSAENAGAVTQLKLLMLRHKAITVSLAAILILSAAFVVKVMASERKATRNATIALASEQKATASEAIAIKKEGETRQALARSALSLAEAALRESNGPAMQMALNDVPENLRDASWKYLLNQSDNSIAQIMVGAEITGMAAHPRLPSVFAMVDNRGKVTVLNVRTGERLLEFDTGQTLKEYYSLAISPDGERLAVQTRTDDGGIVIYNARDGTRLLGWKADYTKSMVFSPDGRSILQAVHFVGLMNLWDATTGKLQWSHECGDKLEGGTFLPDGSQVICHPWNVGFPVLNAQDGSLIRRVAAAGTPRTALSPDGKLLVTTDRTGVIKGIELASEAVVFQVRADNRRIDHFAFTADGSRFVSVAVMSDGRQMIRVWDGKTGAPLQTLLGGSGKANRVAVHPLSGELVVCGDRTHVWSLGAARWTFPGKEELGTIAFWGNEDVVFIPPQGIATPGSNATMLQLQDSATTTIWAAPNLTYAGAQVSADGKFAAIGGFHKPPAPPGIPILKLRRNGSTVEVVGRYPTLHGQTAVRLSPSGQRLAAFQPGETDQIKLFEGDKETPSINLERTDIKIYSDLAWLTDERLLGLVTVKARRGHPGSEDRIVLWDATTGKVLRFVTNASAMDVLAVAPDGSRFAEAGADKYVRVRDATSLAVLQEFRIHDGSITALAWHPTRPILATGSDDLNIRLWNLDDGRQIEEIRGSLTAPKSLAFSPGGRRLGCATLAGITRIWDPVSLIDPAPTHSEDELLPLSQPGAKD